MNSTLLTYFQIYFIRLLSSLFGNLKVHYSPPPPPHTHTHTHPTNLYSSDFNTIQQVHNDKICTAAEFKLLVAQKIASVAEDRAINAERRAFVAEERAARAEETVHCHEITATNAENRAIAAEARAISAGESAAESEQRSIEAQRKAVELSDAFRLAKENATNAERRANVAENRATISSRKASTDEKRAIVAEERATAAENRASVAEERAKMAENEVTATLTKATAAEIKAKSLEERATQAENAVKTLQESARTSDVKMAELVQKNTTLEQTVEGLTTQCKHLQERLDKVAAPSWLVKKGDIVMTGTVLGRGAWGEVKVANYCGLEVAAKLLHDAIASAYNEQLFVREMNISALVRHPNIVLFIGATLDKPRVILTELMPTTLRAVVEDKMVKKVTLSHKQVSTIAIDVGKALNYLHLMTPDAIIHRDVSSSNVLLDPLGAGDMWKAKLSDFGSSNFARQVMTVGPGNYTYAAPETGDPTKQSPKMDVFSFGILLLEMSICQFPDKEKRQDHMMQLTRPWPAMKALIEECTARSPGDRPNIADVLLKVPKI